MPAITDHWDKRTIDFLAEHLPNVKSIIRIATGFFTVQGYALIQPEIPLKSSVWLTTLPRLDLDQFLVDLQALNCHHESRKPLPLLSSKQRKKVSVVPL